MVGYMIVSNFEINGKRYDANIEYCETIERVRERMGHIASREGANLSVEGLYADKTDGRQYTTYRVQRVEVDEKLV